MVVSTRTTIHAQTVDISSAYFSQLEPEIANYDYTAIQTSPLPSGYSIDPVGYQWTVVGNKNSPPLSTMNTSVSWENKPNYASGVATHRIKVRVKYVKNGSPDIFRETPFKDVTVKYTSPFTSFNVNGNSISKGGNTVIPCGNQTVNIVTSGVTTEGNVGLITYTWQKPSGWSGPTSTTSPSATFTSNSGSGGSFVVIASGSNSAFTQGWNVNMVRPVPQTPSITSGSTGVICNGQTRTITASAVNASSYNWTVSGSTNVVSGQGTNTLTYSSNGGNGSISVNGINGCGTGSALGAGGVWGGVPTANVTVQGVAPYGAVQVLAPSIIGTTNYSWYRDGSFLQSTSSNTALLSAGSCGIYHYIQVVLTNTCGNSSISNGIEGGYTWACGSFRASTYPNPAQDILNIEFEDVKDVNSVPQTIKLYSEKSTLEVRKVAVKEAYESKRLENGNKVQINVQALPRGIYFLHVIPNEESKEGIEVVRIVLN